MSIIRLYKAGEGSRSVPSIDSPGWIANGWSTEPVQESVEAEKLVEAVQACPTGNCPVTPHESSDPSLAEPEPEQETEPEQEPDQEPDQESNQVSPVTNKRRRR